MPLIELPAPACRRAKR